MFAATVYWAHHQSWQAGDLAWSLWICSLVLGYAFLIFAIVAMLLSPKGPSFFLGNKGRATTFGPGMSAAVALGLDFIISLGTGLLIGLQTVTFILWGLAAISAVLAAGSLYSILKGRKPWIEIAGIRILVYLPAALFLIAFFTVHFGGFHMIQAIFLSQLFPLAGRNLFKELAPPLSGVLMNFAKTAATAIHTYWMVIAASAFSRWGHFTKAIRTANSNIMFMPYKNVVRMHVMIIAFAALSFTGLSQWGLYLLLVLYFFPVGSLVKLLHPGRKTGQSADHPAR